MTLGIRFELVGAGWMDIHLDADGRSYTLDWLSYLTPVLEDVIQAAIAIAIGADQAEARFERESVPQSRIRFERRWNTADFTCDYFVTALVADDHYFEEIPAAALGVAWEAKVSGFDEIAAAVLAGAKALEAELGHAGYAKEWVESPFPVRAVAALAAALAMPHLPPLRPEDDEI